MANFIFDIDGTLRNFEPELDIDSALYSVLLSLRKENNLFIVTGRTYKKFQQFYNELLSTLDMNQKKQNLFNTIFCEDGHVYYEKEIKTSLVNNEELNQLNVVKKYLNKYIGKKSKKYNISYPNNDSIGEITIIIQEQENKPSFYNELVGYINKHDLNLLKLNKLTHNRLSISIKGIGKKFALQRYGLDFSDSYYFCDEKNDLELALHIKEKGGQVVCPNNAVSEIKEVANYVSQKPYSYAVTDYLSILFKNSSN